MPRSKKSQDTNEEREYRKERRAYLASLSDDERAFRKSVNGLAFEKDIALGYYIVQKEIDAWEKENPGYDGPNIYVVISLGQNHGNELNDARAVSLGPLFQLEQDHNAVLGAIAAAEFHNGPWIVCTAYIENALCGMALLDSPKSPIAYSDDLEEWITNKLPKLGWPSVIKGSDFDCVVDDGMNNGHDDIFY